MVTLTKKEILSELEKFGILTSDEKTAFLSEYNNYYSIVYPES